MKNDPLIEAAGLVADGTVPDWGAMSSRLSSDEERALADELANVARIAEEHRRLHQLLPQTGTASPTALDRASWGHLELLEIVGRGSYGTVYRAWDGRLDRQVALKLFHGAKDPEALMREGRMLARIRHDNVVAVHGADVIDGVAGIWMEFVRGRNLDQIVKEQGPLSAPEATLIGLDMSRALAAVHAAELLHCDVKAQNVIREPGGRLVLMDLGAGRTVPGASDATDIGSLTGTPRYMAPELFTHGPASPQSDLYSLGVLLFYLVTGKFPVDGKTLTEIGHAHAMGRRQRLRDVRPDLPTGYLREVSKALEPDPLQRHRSAGEFEAGLLGLSSTDASKTQSAPRDRLTRRNLLGLVVIAGLAAAGLFAWRLTEPRSPFASTGTRSIAVLPIRNLTGDPSKSYLADGLTEVLISNLARVRKLRVPSFAAVSSFRQEDAASAENAGKLGVELLLAGSVVEAGKQTRLTVQLVEPLAGTVLWAHELIRDSADVLPAQAELARMVASHLALELSPEEERGLSQRSAVPEAQEAFFRGLAEAHTFLSSRFPVAAKHFREAVRIDPQFASAWAELALSEIQLIELSIESDRRSRADSVKQMADQALQLDPTLASGYAALGTVQFYHDWDFAAAEATFRRGLEVGPSSAFIRQRFAMLLAALGRLDEAIPLAREARELEPLVPARAASLGILYYYARDFIRASAEMQRGIALVPTFPPAHFGLGRIYSAMGRYDEATQAIERSMAQERIGAYLVELARVHAAAGHREDVARILNELDALRKAGEGFSFDNYAYVAAAQGRIDDAFAILDTAVEQRLTNLLWIAVDPRVDPLRADPRFNQLLKRIGLRN